MIRPLHALLASLLVTSFGAPALAQNWVDMESQEECLADQGNVRLRVDSYGAFGSSTSVGDSDHAGQFDPAANEAGVDWPEKKTVFESMAFLCIEDEEGGRGRGTWLEHGDMGNNPADFELADGVLSSRFDWNDIGGQLRAELNCNILTECWTFTNNGNSPMGTVALTHYIDGDLFFVGSFGNDYGGTVPGPPRTVFEFDSGDDPDAPTTYVGLSGADFGDRYLTSWELGEYVEQRDRIEEVDDGCTVLRNDIQREDRADADRDDDLITDTGYDITIALRFDVGPLQPGQRTPELCVNINWGVGYACGDPDEDGICSNEDNCPFTFNPAQMDSDADAVGDSCDNCPRTPNSEQIDRDQDTIGDDCDKYVCRVSNDGVETCDELDNDCNGLVDDLDPGFARCPTGLPGVCASGTPRCAGGEMICVVEHQGGRDEVCNMVDDDCDGQIDEAVRNASGRCGPTLPEQCDGLDNDCNGHVDEGNLCAEGWECVDAACRRVCDGAEGSCQGSEHCEEGYCGGPCYGTDCPPGQSCLHDYGAGASCIDPCVEVECPPGTLCDSLGRCAPCEAIGCPPGQTCAGGDRCVPDPCDGVECERDEACVEGECLSSCAAVACAMGESCRRGRCVEDPCGGVRCPDGLVCNENAACVNDECQGTDCQPGEICHRGDCQGDPCIATRCPDPERCEVFCVRNDCFGRCYPNWHAETSVGEGPDPDPEPDPEAPPGDSGADAGLGGDAGRATAGGDGDGQQPGGDGDGPPDDGTLDAGSGGGGVPDAAEGPVQRSTTDCANCSLGASSAQPAWLRLLGVLAGRR